MLVAFGLHEQLCQCYWQLVLIFFSSFQQTAIPILIGTKFDDFAQLPLEMQRAIVNQVSSTVCFV
jgi:hypothetical protein